MVYTNSEYADMAVIANREGKVLKVVDGKIVLENAKEDVIEQPNEKIDPTILALAEAVAAQEERIQALEGGAK